MKERATAKQTNDQLTQIVNAQAQRIRELEAQVLRSQPGGVLL